MPSLLTIFHFRVLSDPPPLLKRGAGYSQASVVRKSHIEKLCWSKSRSLLSEESFSQSGCNSIRSEIFSIVCWHSILTEDGKLTQRRSSGFLILPEGFLRCRYSMFYHRPCCTATTTLEIHCSFQRRNCLWSYKQENCSRRLDKIDRIFGKSDKKIRLRLVSELLNICLISDSLCWSVYLHNSNQPNWDCLGVYLDYLWYSSRYATLADIRNNRTHTA